VIDPGFFGVTGPSVCDDDDEEGIGGNGLLDDLLLEEAAAGDLLPLFEFFLFLNFIYFKKSYLNIISK
jgi:hypothetical protein